MEKFLLKSIALSIVILFCFNELSSAQGCVGGGQASTVIPTGSYQTATLASGQYISFAATAGRYYTFTFCAGGAIAPGYDSELSLFTLGPNKLYAYNGDFCGVNPEITWFCATSGTYNVLLLAQGCSIGGDATAKTIAYKIAVPLNDNICGATYLYSNRCSLTYATYDNSFSTTSPQGAPACGTFTGRDVWFSTKVPSSGYLNINTQAGSITNGALAAYKGASCSAALTLLGCDYDAPGNMPELNLTNLTPGDSVFIRVWSFNNTQAGTFGIGLQDPYPNYCMVGNSAEINNAGKCLNITPNTKSQLGAVWSTTQINMSVAFDYNYSVNLGSSDAGADGLTFTLQNNALGTAAIGSPGYNLGIGPLTNTFIAEFDTYDNGAGQADIPADHIAINVNGNFAAPVAGPIQASSTNANIEDGAYHTVRITWNPVTTVFTIYFDGVVRLSYTNDIINTVFGGNPMVYWGVTGSTGSFTNQQSMCPGTLPGGSAPLPVTWVSFDAAVIEPKVNLSWSTGSENGSKEFIIERSTDGNDFSAVGTVPAQGHSNGLTTYSFQDEHPLTGITYYRLKQIDLNGAFAYSVMKTVTRQSTQVTYAIYPNPSAVNTDLTVELSEEADVEVYDNANVLILQQHLAKGKGTLNTADKQLKAGMYYAVIRYNTGVQYSKLMLNN